MEKLRFIWIAFVALAFVSCSDSGPTETETEVEEPSSEKQFVWNAMNYWYYWQAEVPVLGDNYFNNDDEFYSYLNDFNDAETLFESLLHQDDDFSFFIDDYEEYQDEREGIYAALGMNYGYFYKSRESSDLVGYIRYVVPGSPADDAGLERLELFTKVDGTTITVDNYMDILTTNSAHELTMARLDTTDPQLFVEQGTVSVDSREVIEDPVFHTSILDTNNVKVGYLMYNSFQGNSHQKLNEVFGNFKNEGIDELVLDLRYNGGGMVLTSQLLSSMISGLGSSDKFGEFEYNSKRSQRNSEVFFLDEVPLQNADGDFEQDNQGEFVKSEPMNSLVLPRLYVLVSSGTASASEVLINSLNPYIDVTYIGFKTVGKDEGSLTLYDAPAPYLDDSNANPDHKKAIQPIVLKVVNVDGEDYPNGFIPDGYTADGCVDDDTDNCVNEITIENLLNKPSIGDPEEPLFARALDLIIGQQQPAKSVQKWDSFTRFDLQEVPLKNGIQDLRPHGHGMYVEPFMMPTDEE